MTELIITIGLAALSSVLWWDMGRKRGYADMANDVVESLVMAEQEGRVSLNFYECTCGREENNG